MNNLFITIDGSILEGGGQILRNSIAYSAITTQPIKINNIRGNRSKPGIKKQHLAGILSAKQICKAETEGLELNSIQLTFIPNEIKHNVLENPIKVDIGSAGACSLVIQTILPILFYSKTNTHTNISITGGTNVDFSPPIDFFIHILLPTLTILDISAKIVVEKRGYMPKSGGKLNLQVESSNNSNMSFNSIQLISKGQLIDKPICYIHGYSLQIYLDDIINEINKYIDCIFDIKDVIILDSQTKCTQQILGYFLVGKTDTNCYIHTSSVIYIKEKKYQKTLYENIKRSIKRYEINKSDNDMCVDEYLQDQLIIFMALTKNISKIKTTNITLHTQTAIYFAELMTNARFTIENIDKNHNLIICIPN
jgi:RNA 3'-terminal phosphate cyclase (ATP)